MQISSQWLQEFIDIKATVNETASLLTMAGIETEAMTSPLGQEILVIEITPNRGDCLSVLGIARELSAITKIPLKKRSDNEIASTFDSNISIVIEDNEICSRYTGMVIKGVTVKKSPDDIVSKLAASGIRNVNNVVDITNFVQIELGTPLHAFDLATLKGDIIRINRAGNDCSIKTIDGVTRVLPKDAITIFDQVRPIAIGGIMGGSETEITNTTKDIFLECAYFNPAFVRAGSKGLGLKSDSSYRFERGTDILYVLEALKRTASLILDLCGGAASNIIDVYPTKYQPIEIAFDSKDVKRLLGIEIGDDEIARILRTLGFNINTINKVSPPSFRSDMELPADIIEEIARIYGYDRIPSVMPKTDISINQNDRSFTDRFLIMDYMKQAGYTEVINYSFMSNDSLKGLNIPSDDIRANAVPIKNPLRKDHTVMRSFILPSLINNLVYNYNRGAEDINIYEISKVFIKTDEILPDEKLFLFGLSFNNEAQVLWAEPAGIFYRIKGMIQGMFEGFGHNEYLFKPSDEPFLFKGQSLDIIYNSEKIGYLGMLSPEVVAGIDIKAKNPMIAVFSINMEIFLNLPKKRLKYVPISKFPVINRDIALLVDSNLEAGGIQEMIRMYPDPLISTASVFDSYAGKNIPKGKKNLAFHVTYKSTERTLLDLEVDQLHNKIVEHILNETKGILR